MLTSSHAAKTSKLNFFIILLTGFVDYLGIGLVYPIFAVLLFDESNPTLPFDSSPEYRGAILGILIGLTPISQFFLSPILGVYSDLRGRRIALILGISVGCLGYAMGILGVYFNSLLLLFLYRILVGASDATAGVAQATLVDISTEENKAKRFAYLNSSLGFGFTFGPFIGGIIADPSIVSWFNYSTPLIVAGLLALTNLLLVCWKFPETRNIADQPRSDMLEGLHKIRKVFMLKNLKWLFFGGFSLAFGWAFFNEFIPVLLHERFNFSLIYIGDFYAYTGVWYAVGALLTARFVHLFSAGKVVVVALFISAISMLSFAIIHDSFYIWWVVPVLMSGLACAYPTATTIVSNQASSDKQGEVLGVYQSVGAAAWGLSPIFVGSAIGAYPALTAWGGAFFLFLAGLAFWKRA